MKPETNISETCFTVFDALMHKPVNSCLVIFLGLFCLQTVSAQDIITRMNGSEIKTKVIEISPEQVKYKRFDNPDGPIYTENTDRIRKINYANGTEDMFDTKADVSSQEIVFHQVAREERKTSKIRYSGLIELAPYYGIDYSDGPNGHSDCSGAMFSTAHGIQLNDKYFFGLGFGMNSGDGFYLPVYAAFRMDLSKGAARPFLGASLGTQFGYTDRYYYYADNPARDEGSVMGVWANITAGYRFKNKFYLMSGLIAQNIPQGSYDNETYRMFGFTIGIGVKF